MPTDANEFTRNQMVVGRIEYSPDYSSMAQIHAPTAAAMVMADKLQPEIDRLKVDNARLRAAIEGWAQECSECDGTGQKWSGDVSNPDLSPCTDCADIRALLQP